MKVVRFVRFICDIMLSSRGIQRCTSRFALTPSYTPDGARVKGNERRTNAVGGGSGVGA